jgi:hypothetical protein
MLRGAHAAEEEGRLGLRRVERRDQMRRARRIRPVVEGDRDRAFAGAILVDAAEDRRPVSEGDAEGDQGSASTLAGSATAVATALRSPKAAR